jgi:NAD dependent epimerase/dehydratase
MKNLLVTGADGFIGSHLTELLLERGYSVRALAQYNSFGSWGWLDRVQRNKNLQVVLGDIRDPFFCDELVRDMDGVFHLAALIAIPYSYQAPHSYMETNAAGTINICKAALKQKVKRFIQTSTSEVYGTAQYVPIDERHPLQPQSPYSASKIAADSVAMSFYYSFGLPVTVARPFNTYGPRQSARAVIPTIISQIAAGKSEIDLGDTSPTRDFNYVKDTCRGMLALLESEPCIGRTVNIGSNFEISIEATFEKIKEIMRSDATIIRDLARVRPEKSEVKRLWCDNTLIHKLTGYTPITNFEQGLRLTIDWFSKPENLIGYKNDLYNI